MAILDALPGACWRTLSATLGAGFRFKTYYIFFPPQPETSSAAAKD